MSVPQIARMWMTDEEHVRRVIHDFNAHGFDSLRPRFRGGRPRRIQTYDEQRIGATAGARADSLGVPYTRWILAKLSRYLAGQGIAVSPAHLGRILARNGISLVGVIPRTGPGVVLWSGPTPRRFSLLSSYRSPRQRAVSATLPVDACGRVRA
ncbi:MAG: hypothetical protein KatS3mg082_2886 [Nitrospiraceae bacterium]|nr:MAG: hypothetical protein KatS3mg082_2886 [Nitrospiraceae bacterium]